MLAPGTFNRSLVIPVLTSFCPLMRFVSPALFSYRNPNPIHLLTYFARSFSLPLSGDSYLCSDIPYLVPSSRFCSIFPPNLRVHPSRLLSVESGLVRFSSTSFPSVGGSMSAVASMAEEAISPAKEFWLKSQKEAMLAKYTPFIVCLASGKLELETFRRYIAQDVLFLRSFARA